MNIIIRGEMPADIKRIGEVTESAFRDAPYASHTEQFIVKSLREAKALSISLVAEADGTVIGHVALSLVCVSDGAANWYGLGPISVLPEYQGQGVGSKLMEEALAEIETKGAAGCVLLGDPFYYGRFGFKAVEGLVLPGVPPEYFQALSFGDSFAQGEVTYHEAFSARG